MEDSTQQHLSGCKVRNGHFQNLTQKMLFWLVQ